ncbi:MAG: alpha/beta fold hydrolase [Nocardioides sp.]
MSAAPARVTAYAREGLTFDVRDEGPLDGTPVVLLHGFPERSTSWREVAPLLHAAGCRTYAPDQRGYAPGARPRRRRDYRLPLLVADVVALVERIGAPVHLVGHDWGAAVAWLVASERPDLVRTLTAVSVPHPSPFVRAMLTSRQGLASYYMLLFQVPGLAERLARTAGGRIDIALRRGGMTLDEVARFRREVVEDGALRGALGWYRALPLVDPRSTGGPVTVPTTFVWGERDVAILRGTAERCAAWVTADYRFVPLPGVGHWIPTQAPVPLAEAVLARMGA